MTPNTLPAGPSPWLPQRVRIRILIASLVVCCMGLMAALLLLLGWSATRDRLVQQAGQQAQTDALLLEERTKRMLEPARTALRQLSFDSLGEANSEAERLARIHVLTEELTANPLLSAIYIGYGNGDFVLARPLRKPTVRKLVQAPEAARFVVQTVSEQSDGSRLGSYHFRDAQGRWLRPRVDPDYRFDPRQRPWFDAALRVEPAGPVLSAPYRFFTTGELGISLSQQSLAGHAVVGVDLVLDELTATLRSLRATPATQLALVDARGQLLAHTGTAASAPQDRLPRIDEIGVPALQALRAQAPPLRELHQTELEDGRWLGMRLPFEVGIGDGLELLKSSPMRELVGPAVQRAQRVTLIAAGLALLLLPVGWYAGGSIGNRLKRLRERAQRLSRFDFAVEPLKPSMVREVSELTAVMQQMGGTIEAFLNLSERLATEPEVERMLQQVLEQLTRATQSTAAAVFLWENGSERMQRAAQAGELASPIPEHFAYPLQRGPRSGPRAHGPQLRHLDLELRGRDGRLKGLLVLEFVADAGHDTPAFLTFARQLSGMLAVAIETRQLIEAQRKLFDAVIRLMADAIDAKSPYTGGHCERVPQLAIELLDRLCAEREGPYAGFSLGETERYAFRLGAWLHDCGKVTSPEHIVDKASKLELIHNRIHEVRARFEILWRDAEIAQLRGTLDAAGLQARQAQLRDDWAFVAQCNVGGEFMADADVERLRQIGAQPWLRHFDDRLGLAAEELRRLDQARPAPPPLPAAEPLLADRPEHVVPWDAQRPPVERGDPRNLYGFDMRLPAHKQNQGELHNLAIRRGTLTEEDRFRINDHIVQTYVMLKGLPWPEGLERVPELAATHHEKLDGQGYPRRLPAEKLGLPDRVMALADVFEALTAADRPYKPAKTLTETLTLMALMCKDRHLDAELFRYFLRSRLWDGFAERFMQPGQRDAVDLAAIEALLPRE